MKKLLWTLYFYTIALCASEQNLWQPDRLSKNKFSSRIWQTPIGVPVIRSGTVQIETAKRSDFCVSDFDKVYIIDYFINTYFGDASVGNIKKRLSQKTVIEEKLSYQQFPVFGGTAYYPGYMQSVTNPDIKDAPAEILSIYNRLLEDDHTCFRDRRISDDINKISYYLIRKGNDMTFIRFMSFDYAL